MRRPRRFESAQLLEWAAAGNTTEEMKMMLDAQGKFASIDLVRLRLREARQEARGEPPKPAKPRKDTATAGRLRLMAEAVERLEELREELDAAVAGWEDHFAGTARYERFTEASESLGAVLDALEGVDLSY